MIMQDSYKELINEVLVIELIDCEVDWIDWYKQINAFCNVKSDEYDYWKDRKILIKDVASKYDPIDHCVYLQDLSLFITDYNLQDLIRRKGSLNVITNSLGSLIDDDWGRDHEHFGGEYYTYTEKGIVPQNGYLCKFNLQKLFSIIRSGCMIKNEGSSYDNNSYNATSFYTNEGKKVYVTAGFLYLLQSIFKVREDALDVAIQRLTIKSAAPKEIEQGKIKFIKTIDNLNKIDFDICLIGAGAYGFPLAAYVKKIGKKGFHLGGSLQLLFGIKGKRWEDPNYNEKYKYNQLMNEYWVKPNEKDKPRDSQNIENACYW